MIIHVYINIYDIANYKCVSIQKLYDAVSFIHLTSNNKMFVSKRKNLS